MPKSQVEVGCPGARELQLQSHPKAEEHPNDLSKLQPSHELPAQSPQYSTHHTEARGSVEVKNYDETHGQANLYQKRKRGGGGDIEKRYTTRSTVPGKQNAEHNKYKTSTCNNTRLHRCSIPLDKNLLPC